MLLLITTNTIVFFFSNLMEILFIVNVSASADTRRLSVFTDQERSSRSFDVVVIIVTLMIEVSHGIEQSHSDYEFLCLQQSTNMLDKLVIGEARTLLHFHICYDADIQILIRYKFVLFYAQSNYRNLCCIFY